MASPFTTVRSIAMPLLCDTLLRDNVDTDVIIRVERLFGAVPRDQLGPYAFEILRYRADGSLDPQCTLNDARYRDAAILIAGANFGCGSAREGAVWALAGMGIRVILAPSFGEIFVTNCYANGLLPVALPPARIERLAATSREAPRLVTVDLTTRSVRGPDGVIDAFAIPALRRQALLEGLDDIALTLTRADEIGLFRRDDAVKRPWVSPSALSVA